MLSRGVHPKIVSERLGHASVNITLDTYSHVLPGLQVAAAAQPDVSSLSLRPGLVSNPLARPIEAPVRSLGRAVLSVRCGGRYWTRTSDFLGVSEAL
jgi:hypothetical protein